LDVNLRGLRLTHTIYYFLISKLATGGSAIKAIETLIDYGVAEERILFLNLISCPEGIAAVVAKFPAMKIVTAEIDAGLDEKLYINPGLGDFGCRYFGTDK
jgi:uracil phosphoribosyltransferase